MKKVLFLTLSVIFVLSIANISFAYGPHDENCVECHSIHQAKGESLPAVYNTTEKYTTGEALKSVDAFCIGCHNKNTGIMPIEIHKTHPVGVAPKKAKVPADYLRKGTFVCVSCHDPHPSNPNYKYLIIDTNGGKNLGKFCGFCHPAQVSPAEAPKPASAPASAPATAPKKK